MKKSMFALHILYYLLLFVFIGSVGVVGFMLGHIYNGLEFPWEKTLLGIAAVSYIICISGVIAIVHIDKGFQRRNSK